MESAVTDDQILEWMPIVRSVVLKHHRQHLCFVEIDDLVQIGILAVMEALTKYDPSKGKKLSGHVFQYMRWRMTEAIRDMAPLSRKTYQKTKVDGTGSICFVPMDEAMGLLDLTADHHSIRTSAEFSLLRDRIDKLPQIYREVFYKTHEQLGICRDTFSHRRHKAVLALREGRMMMTRKEQIARMTKYAPTTALGAALQARRKQTGMKAAQEALACGRPYVYKLEREVGESAAFSTWLRISQYLGITLDEAWKLSQKKVTP